MKCEHCGKNEVTFYFKSNVNGTVTEKHLCADCAAKLGYTQNMAARNRQFMENMLPGGFLEDLFSPMPRLLGGMDRFFGEDPWDDFFREMPALSARAGTKAQPQPPAEKKEEDLVSGEEQSRFARMREMNALRAELRKAIHREDFERAAQLRDQIHAKEQEHKEGK